MSSRESLSGPPRKVLPSIIRRSLPGSTALDTKERHKTPIKLADCSPKTELLDARTTYQNLRRARVYAKNNVLKRLEIENFEKLKSDVASGNLVLETVTWSSDDSSSQTSPSGTSDDHKSGYKEVTHKNSRKDISVISQSAVCSRKGIDIAEKGQSQIASVISGRTTQGRRIYEPTTKETQKRQLSRGRHFGGV